MEDPRERIDSLEAQLQRMRSIFRRTSEALFCWEMVRPVPIDAPIEAQIEGLADGVLVECNEVAAIGYGYASAAEILGKHSNEVWQRPPPNHAQLLRAFCAANYELTGFRLSVDYPDGSTRVFENEVFGVVEDGAVVRTWGSARDVTDRLNLEAELIRAQKLDAVGRLAGAVAHDYNNLLTAILGGLDLLREIPGDAELLAMVTSAAERSAKLTRRMLGLSRHAVVQRRATAVAEVLGG
ncbi:putative histidine kinase, partial [Plesiocystis pacifica SIR-1]